MKNEKGLEEAYAEYLDTINVHVLRNVARELGVGKPTVGKKAIVIAQAVDVLMGRVQPVPPSKLGAPLKQGPLDPKYLRDLATIRERFLGNYQPLDYANVLQARSKAGGQNSYDQSPYKGILEIMPNGCGYLRVRNAQPTEGLDVFISSQNVRDWQLKEGDCVVGFGIQHNDNKNPSLIKVLSVNEETNYRYRPNFDSFFAYYPEEKIEFSAKNNLISLRYIDLFSPIGKGQRAIVVAPSATGVSTLLKDIALSVREKINAGENYHLLTLILDERPEEITEFNHATRAEEFYYTTFSQNAQEHLNLTKLVFARAKRLAEAGKDVVLLLDSLTRLTYAANACATDGNMLVCGLKASAFNFPKACLGEAANYKEGSISVIATLSINGQNATEEAVVNEFEKVCNCRISLDADLAKKRIYPAIDVNDSHTRRDETLLTKEEKICADTVRRQFSQKGGEALFEQMKNTESNAAFISKILKS